MESIEPNQLFWWYIFVKLLTDSDGIFILVYQTPVNILVIWVVLDNLQKKGKLKNKLSKRDLESWCSEDCKGLGI